MQPTPDKATIIIAGMFNPAIIQPKWIGKNVLDPPVLDEFPVNMMAPIPVSSLTPPRLTFAGISYAPSFQTLAFYLEGLDLRGCQRVCDVSARILELLPHTPITGVGFNFGYTEDQPTTQMLQLLQTSAPFVSALGRGAEVVDRHWANTASWGDSLVTIQGSMRGSAPVSIELNFHYAVQDAAGAVAVLRRENVYADHKSAAESAAATINQE